jgi:outer membrane immunogenic protein
MITIPCAGRILTLLAATSLVGLAGEVRAADLVPAVSTASSWQGLYVGGALGAGALSHRVSAGGQLFGANLAFDGLGGEGVFGSVFAGYDWHLTPRVVAGVFGDVSYGNVGSRAAVSVDVLGITAGAQATLTARWGATVGARAGVLVSPSTLLYALAGLSWQQFDSDVDVSVTGLPLPSVAGRTSDHVGLTAGLGIETLIDPRWSLRGEYRFTQFDAGSPFGLGVDFTPSLHTARLGLAYRFGGSAPAAAFAAPVPAWTGLWIGAQAGVGIVDHRFSGNALGILSAVLDGMGSEGFEGGLSAGFDWRVTDRVVIGAMADVSLGAMETTLSAGINAPAPVGNATARGSVRSDVGYSVTARGGLLMNPSTLVYALAGYTWQDFDFAFSIPGTVIGNGRLSFDGPTVGAGVETALTRNLTAKLEYRFTPFDGNRYFGGVLGIEPSAHVVRAGLAWRFGAP